MSTNEYIPLTTHPDNEPSDEIYLQKYYLRTYLPAILIALLSVANFFLLPFTISASRSTLESLPYPDKHLGLDRAAQALPVTPVYAYAWPDKITRFSRKLKDAVYGKGPQVFISVQVRLLYAALHFMAPVFNFRDISRLQDTTLMRFPIPANGTSCAITWTPALGARKNDLETKGDISEIEVWSTISPNVIHSPSFSNLTLDEVDLDFDNLSWNTRPVTGELLGTLDLTARPNATTVEFNCPQGSLTVEFRCLRVACYAQFMQVRFVPKMGLELVRRLN